MYFYSINNTSLEQRGEAKEKATINIVFIKKTVIIALIIQGEDMQEEISKAQLIVQINLWKNAKISATELQAWMVTFYDPPEVKIGTGESETVVDAMNIIMNEYELAKVEKFKVESADAALTFLNCTEHDFEQCKYLFVHQGFLD